MTPETEILIGIFLFPLALLLVCIIAVALDQGNNQEITHEN